MDSEQLDVFYAKKMLPHIAESVTAQEYRNDYSRLLDQYIAAAEEGKADDKA
jgi:hypothetical protein